MPQKPLGKAGKGGRVGSGKKDLSAHLKAKRAAVQKKGALHKPPKKPELREKFLEQQEISRQINLSNESNLSVVAAAQGGSLSVLRPDPVAVREATKSNLPRNTKKTEKKNKKPELVSAHM